MPLQAPYEDGTPRGTQVCVCVCEAIVLREIQLRMGRGRYTGFETLDYMTGRPFDGRLVFQIRLKASPLQVNPLKWIVRFRLGEVTTYQKLTERDVGRLPPWFAKFCPFCKRRVPKTIYQMVFLCRRWTIPNNKWLGGVREELKIVHKEILQVPEVDTDLFSMPKCVRLNIVLGGASYKRGLENWFPSSLGKLEDD